MAGPSLAFPEGLETERLAGERIVPEHEPDVVALALDPRVYRTLWPWSFPPTIADVRSGLRRQSEHWERHGFGLWLLRDRADGTLVGRGGLQYTDVLGGHAVEVAWAVVPARWGEGLATELAQAAVALAFHPLGLDEVIAVTLPDNRASRRVMEKAGFADAGEVEHVGLEHVLYRRAGDIVPEPGDIVPVTRPVARHAETSIFRGRRPGRGRARC